MKDDSDLMIARLDGFLEALAAIDGATRERVFSAFTMDVDQDDIASSLKQFFGDDAFLGVSTINQIIEWDSYLERELAQITLNDLIGKGAGVGSSQLDERKRDVAFRIMDMISFASEQQQPKCLFDVKARFGSANVETKFFALHLGTRYLVLQFSGSEYLAPD